MAWAPVPGKVAVGSYAGNNSRQPRHHRDRLLAGVGRGEPLEQRSRQPGESARPQAGLHRRRRRLEPSLRQHGAENDDIQKLQADGFQLGKRVPVNGNVAPNTYYWAAFGPHLPQTNLRSIGTAPPYGTGTSA